MEQWTILFGVCLIFGLFSISDSAKNYDRNENGSGICLKQIPRKSVMQRCTTENECRDLGDYGHENSICRENGECVLSTLYEPDSCVDACKTSVCGKLCSHQYQTKKAKYCVRSRDHPNSIPSSVYEQEPNKYQCVCLV